MNQILADTIAHLNPCAEAVAWLAGQQTPAQAWRDCQRGDWMLWLIGTQVSSEPWSDDRKPLLACALDCAETVRHLWPEAHRETLATSVQTLRDWIAGTATAEQARAAARATSDVAGDEAWAADAATWAAVADDVAAWMAVAADAVARVPAWATAMAAAWATGAGGRPGRRIVAAEAAAEAATLARCADIVRRHYPETPRIARPK